MTVPRKWIVGICLLVLLAYIPNVCLSAPMIRETYIYAPNIRISYEVDGRGNRPMILLHGFGASLESWNDILPSLNDFRTYRLDLKGHGLSAKPQDNHYSLHDQAEIVAGFLTEQHLSNAVLVGHSYGGGVTLLTYLLLAAGSRPNPIAAIILIDAAAYPQTLPFFVALLRNPIWSPLIQNLVPARTRAAKTLHRLFYDPKLVTEERISRYARYFDLPNAHYALTECARQIVPTNSSDLLAKIKTITAPTLIIWGANDPIILQSTGQRLHGDIVGSQFALVEQCGHIPPEEKPAETAAVIKRFLAAP